MSRAIDVAGNVDTGEHRKGTEGSSALPSPVPDPGEAFKSLCVRDRFDPIFLLGSLAYLLDGERVWKM